MASKKLGHTNCPECGHHEAHVKISLDGENKKPYRHCPECYASYHPRNKHQADMLLAKMKASDEPNTLPEPVEPAPTVAPAAPAAPEKEDTEYEMVFGVRVPKKKVAA
ncbi:hypothetical protein HFRIS_004973 [Herbaspirillum frisingense GSF30]|uniref:Uncharacterized protein n=1 Tax=Herbaspirillum frisingense GSF30 TaxID=864073 RepID=A0AAI9N4P5_9BURK|nr:hypothetical protein [Herbaspirillum frisingense]EOA05783.1 hypothetical protein HFRIS_004973 [Herbaspirillum frisingense GSF30]